MNYKLKVDCVICNGNSHNYFKNQKCNCKKFTGKTNDKKRILQLISSSFKHNIGGKDDSINVIMYGGRLGNWR